MNLSKKIALEFGFRLELKLGFKVRLRIWLELEFVVQLRFRLELRLVSYYKPITRMDGKGIWLFDHLGNSP